MRGRGTIRATRIRGLAEPRRSDGDEVEVLFTKLKRGRLVTARNHFCRDESGCEGEAGKPMTMVAASCGGPRRIESRRCSSITCAANGSRGRGRRWSDSVVRAGRGGPPEQAPVSARPDPVGSVESGRAALTKRWGVDRSRPGDVRDGHPLPGRGHRRRRSATESDDSRASRT